MKKVVYAAAVAIALAVGAGAYLNTGSEAAPASTFVLLDGSKQSAADFKGKVTLVNFWATAIDNTGAVARAWGDIALTPTTFVVNKRGEVVKRYVGEPDFAALHKLIEKLLADA